MIPLSLIGCNNNKKEEPITNIEESTIIKNAKSTDEYLKKQDYKSLAYAFIYNIKEGLQSYESETSGTVKAKVMFFDYNIKYHTITYKKGNAFYSKDDSTSPFINVSNEFYMVNNEKILVSRDLKKYDVYKMEDYRKISYSPEQYTVMGYVFNDQSIIKTDVVSDQGENISVKYTLDNDLSTNWVKNDLKCNGGLSNFPTFDKIEITLTMKRDFTPVSYVIDAVYDASKPVIGSSKVTQHGECLFSKVNEQVVIPNEAALAEKLGATPSELIIDDKETQIKNELLAAAGKLPFATGVNVNGALTLDLMGSKMALNIDTNLVFDIKRLSTDKIYEVLNFYAKIEGDQYFNTLLSLVKQFAGDKLGDYANLLDGFKSVEAVYDGAGSLYLIPTNIEDVHATIFKVKIADILDLILQNINLYNLISGANNDLVSFEKVPGKDANNYQVKVILNEETIASIKNAIEGFINNPTYSMIKMILQYKDFDSIKVSLDVTDGVISALDASFNYIKSDADSTLVTLASLHLSASGKTFDYASKLTYAKELYDSNNSVQDLKARLIWLAKYSYPTASYISNIDKAIEEYNALNDTQKGFIEKKLVDDLLTIKTNINNVLAFAKELAKYDLDHLDNASILELSKVRSKSSVPIDLLTEVIGEEKYQKLNSIGDHVDYSIFDGAVSKFEGDDENAWGLTEEEVRGIKLLYDISEYVSGVSTHFLTKLAEADKATLYLTLQEKINNLYNKLS